MSAEPVVASRLRPVPLTAAQTRVVTAALELFTTYGVGGTSLQMIANAVGITKASVYYQFKTKEQIVIAAAEVDLARLEQALDAAEAEPDRPQALEMLLSRLVDLAVENRSMISMLQSDPVMVRLVADYQPFRELMDRLHRLLVGDDPRADQRVPAAMLTAAIGSAAMHPLVVDVDDDTLRSNLLELARRFLGLP
jgi:AcrR family transcriptional regulator